MNRPEYIRNTIQCRFIANRSQDAIERQTLAILGQAFEDLSRLMNLTANKEGLTYANYAAKRKAIEKIMMDMTGDINSTVRFGIKGTAQNITGFYAANAGAYAASYGLDIGASFSTVPLAATKNVINRVWMDGFNFSDRVWRMGENATNGVKEILTAGISRGESAVAMSKELQRFLVNPEITGGTSWTTGAVPSVTGRGSIHYQALRLARTEINNAYRETMALDNLANPITLGMKYNLSKNHPVTDICDVYAEADLYGKGPGVYPADRFPMDHPGGRCYGTDMVRPVSQWEEKKERLVMQDLPKEEILAPMASMPESAQRQAWKSYNSMQTILSQEVRKYRKAS